MGTATRVTAASGGSSDHLSRVCDPAVPPTGPPVVAAAKDTAAAVAAASASAAAAAEARKQATSRSPANSSVPNAMHARLFCSSAGLPLAQAALP